MKYFKITTIVETEDYDAEDLRRKIDTDLNRGDGIYMEIEDAKIEEVKGDSSIS